ncbi:MAG: hypothetical protein ACXWYS_05210 [Gaiellaceae bacterium]
MKKRIFQWGGVAASVMLMAFGIGSLVIGMQGRSEVQDKLAQEKIVGSSDMTPALIKQAAQESNLPASIPLPTCSVADQSIDTGAEAKCFADYMRIHALEATGGKTYAELGRYVTADGTDTNDVNAAAKDPKTGAPVANGARDTWITETALSTALNTSFFAEQVALFSMVMGIALLLTGIGFFILTLGGALGTFSWRKAKPDTDTKLLSAGGGV